MCGRRKLRVLRPVTRTAGFIGPCGCEPKSRIITRDNLMGPVAARTCHRRVRTWLRQSVKHRVKRMGRAEVRVALEAVDRLDDFAVRKCVAIEPRVAVRARQPAVPRGRKTPGINEKRDFALIPHERQRRVLMALEAGDAGRAFTHDFVDRPAGKRQSRAESGKNCPAFLLQRNENRSVQGRVRDMRTSSLHASSTIRTTDPQRRYKVC